MRFALCLIPALLFALVVRAQEPDAPAPAPMDELSKKLVEGWKKSEYHLGVAGVKTASYTVKLNMKAPMPMAATGKYKWDGKKGSIAWDNPMMEAQGKDTSQHDRYFDVSEHQKRYSGSKMTAKAEENGTRITVEGSPENIREIMFDADGVLTGLVLSQQEQSVRVTMGHRRVGEHYLMESVDVNVDTPMGPATQSMKASYTEMGGYHVPTGIKIAATMGGAPTSDIEISYTDWTINGESMSGEGCGCGEPEEGCGCDDGCGCGCEDGCGCGDPE